eukprot:GGOE01033917.1.p1 GENE.GGOE01033917.1~~GGOE01033917.1.p1  ORF type:complete len:443 (-),score=126.86 GGOE01033917.1:639-1967(-)
MVLLPLLCLLAWAAPVFSGKYLCRNEPPWPVNLSNNAECMELFFRWLYARQFDHRQCATALRPNLGYTHGLGSSVLESVRLMLKSLEEGVVYRPKGDWPWAARDAAYCHLKLTSVDCFSMPLSVCHAPQADVTTFTDLTFNFSEALAAFPLRRSAHGCKIAKALRKPTLWVVASLIRYHWRFPPTMQQQIDDKVRQALGGRPEAFIDLQEHTVRHHAGQAVTSGTQVREVAAHTRHNAASWELPKRTLSAALHVRSGQPDARRKPLDVRHYIQAVDVLGRELGAHGFTVTQVYLCSNVPEVALVSVEHLRAHYPRNYTYAMLPHVSFGNKEAELVLKHQKAKKHARHTKTLPPAQAVFLEYVTDVEVMVKADIFIGTYSNVYTLAASLRGLHFPSRPPHHTCYLDSREDPPPLVCEGTEEGRKFWTARSDLFSLGGGSPTFY